LVQTPDGFTAPTALAEVAKVAGVIGADPDIAQVVTYYQTHDPSMVARNGGSTIVVGFWKQVSDQQAVDGATRLEDAFKNDPNVKLGGFAAINHQLNILITGDLAHAELLAFPILFLLSLWVFRGVIAALLPPLVGGIVILGSFLFLRGVAEVHSVSIFALTIAEVLLFLPTGPVNSAILGAAPPGRRATAMALSIFAIHLFGDIPSPPLIGLLSRATSLETAFRWLPGPILVAGMIWCTAAWRGRKPLGNPHKSL